VNKLFAGDLTLTEESRAGALEERKAAMAMWLLR